MDIWEKLFLEPECTRVEASALPEGHSEGRIQRRDCERGVVEERLGHGGRGGKAARNLHEGRRKLSQLERLYK